MNHMIEITEYPDKIEEMSVRRSYEALTKALIDKGLTITTMESCTSGQIASLITDTEGASAIMKGACITYSNEAKIMDGVPRETIDKYGVYSPETALAMAKACREKYSADFGIGITGSFGNVDPANRDSVPGEVFFAIEDEDGSRVFHCRVPVQGSRIEYKLYMANLVAEQLKTMIGNTAYGLLFF